MTFVLQVAERIRNCGKNMASLLVTGYGVFISSSFDACGVGDADEAEPDDDAIPLSTVELRHRTSERPRAERLNTADDELPIETAPVRVDDTLLLRLLLEFWKEKRNLTNQAEPFEKKTRKFQMPGTSRKSINQSINQSIDQYTTLTQCWNFFVFIPI